VSNTGSVSPGRLPDADELVGLGLYDPSAPDAADRLELVRYVLSLGASTEEIEQAPNLGELALDLILRPRGSRTVREAAARLAADWPFAQALMTMVGLPADPDDVLTADESASLELLSKTAPELLGAEATTQVARVVGHTMARLAETLVEAFRLHVQLPHHDAGTAYSDIVREYARITETVLPEFMRTLEAALRRQIVAVTERVWSTDEDRSAVTLLRTVGFVDLVGFTATVSRLSVRQLTGVLVDFDRSTTEVVLNGNGQVVKTIGDEVMFVTEHAADACRIALDLVDVGGSRLPPMRVGLASGEMVSVFGDLYGPDVNLASRLVGVAGPGSVVASEGARDGAADLDVEFEPLPPLELKGIPPPTNAYRVRRSAHES
jgi:adenylate cyclase